MAVDPVVIYGPQLAAGGGNPFDQELGPGQQATLKITDAINNDVTTIQVLSHCTTNTPALDGIGVGIALAAQDDAGDVQEAVHLNGILTDVSDGTEDGAFEVVCAVAGALPSANLHVDSVGIAVNGTTTNFGGQAGTAFLSLGPGTGAGDKRGTIEFVGDSPTNANNGIGAIHGYSGSNRILALFFRRGSSPAHGNYLFQTANGGSPASQFEIHETGSIVIGSGSVTTTASDGFLYIRSCAGVPTGTPSSRGGRAALVYDSSGNNLYAHDGSGGWNLV